MEHYCLSKVDGLDDYGYKLMIHVKRQCVLRVLRCAASKGSCHEAMLQPRPMFPSHHPLSSLAPSLLPYQNTPP